jgi:hypothetical protein
MPTINLRADISIDALLKAAEQLSEPDLRRFASEVMALSAKRTAPSAPKEEADLLQKINQRFPAETQERYDQLTAKRDAETLTQEEHQELLRLTAEAEALDTERVEALTKLATLRGMTLGEVMRQLQIDVPGVKS